MASKEEESLEKYQMISAIEDSYDEKPHSDVPRDLLAKYQERDPLEYANLTTQGLGKLISTEKKHAIEDLKETLTYDWLIKNKKISEIIQILPLLPELKDKDRYKKILGTLKTILEGRTALENPLLANRYVKSYYAKKIEDAKDKKDAKGAENAYATLYASLSSDELSRDAAKGIIEEESNKLLEELKKAGAKEK